MRLIPTMLSILALASCTTPPREDLSPMERGRISFIDHGCMSCHSTNGSRLLGPTLKGLYQSQVGLVGGSVVLADVGYIQESIKAPTVKIVKGFNDIMPGYTGNDVDDLVEYIKSLK